MSPDEMIAVIQAHKEGKRIECGNKKDNVWGTWTLEAHHMNFQAFDYRIAREPRKCWVKWDDDKSPFVCDYHSFDEVSAKIHGWQLVIEDLTLNDNK